MDATSSAAVVAQMADAAEAFLGTLDEAGRVAATGRLGGRDYRQWTYLPGPRPGLCLADMSVEQRATVLALLDAGCSAAGAKTARAVIGLDMIHRQLVADPDLEDHRFWVRVLGDPTGEQPWAWRVNGHHLAVHVVAVSGSIASTPSFYGANPATVPSGPHRGLRTLSDEEELARLLLADLDGPLRTAAITSDRAPADIRTRFDPVADPTVIDRGLAHGDMTPAQQDALQRLVRHYFGRATEATAERAWAEAVEAGLDEIRFGWAGSDIRGEGHYYSVLGPTLLIEYDNTQDDANHIHTVWRDLRHDWGDDLLLEHYAEGHPS